VTITVKLADDRTVRDTAGVTEQLPLEQWQQWWKHFGGRELRHLLLLWWDPVGVYGTPEAIDEYDGYSGQIAKRLRDGAREPEIQAYLRDAEDDRIGVSGDAATAARKIVEWHDQVLRQLGGGQA
jgi:hypothetical protein